MRNAGWPAGSEFAVNFFHGGACGKLAGTGLIPPLP